VRQARQNVEFRAGGAGSRPDSREARHPDAFRATNACLRARSAPGAPFRRVYAVRGAIPGEIRLVGAWGANSAAIRDSGCRFRPVGASGAPFRRVWATNACLGGPICASRTIQTRLGYQCMFEGPICARRTIQTRLRRSGRHSGRNQAGWRVGRKFSRHSGQRMPFHACWCAKRTNRRQRLAGDFWRLADLAPGSGRIRARRVISLGRQPV
jgi:hypothetical protein